MLLLSLACCMAAQSGAGQGLPAASSLPGQVAEAVARDLKIDSPEVLSERNLQVLTPLSSLPAGAALHVVSAKAGGDSGTWLLRLDCASRRDCLPFHVLLHAAETDITLPGKRGTLTANPRSGSSARKSGTATAPVARSGDQVELVEELSGMRLRAKAVCLESGGLGEWIRVRNLATRRIVSAKIAGKAVVRVEP